MTQFVTSCDQSIGDSASASVLPMTDDLNDSKLISTSNNWFDLLAFEGTLKNLLQHHNSKASILQRSPFFVVQLSHPQTLTVPNAGEDAEQKKLSFIAGGNAKWYSHFGRQAISYKTKHSGTIYQSCILIFTQRN